MGASHFGLILETMNVKKKNFKKAGFALSFHRRPDTTGFRRRYEFPGGGNLFQGAEHRGGGIGRYFGRLLRQSVSNG